MITDGWMASRGQPWGRPDCGQQSPGPDIILSALNFPPRPQPLECPPCSPLQLVTHISGVTCCLWPDSSGTTSCRLTPQGCLLCQGCCLACLCTRLTIQPSTGTREDSLFPWSGDLLGLWISLLGTRTGQLEEQRSSPFRQPPLRPQQWPPFSSVPPNPSATAAPEPCIEGERGMVVR